MIKIIPTVFAHNKKEFDGRFAKLIKVSRELQVDFMDGIFVPGRSVKLKEVPSLKKYKNKFEAHLMVEHPEKWIPWLKKKGFCKVIIHMESKGFLEALTISKEERMKIFIGVNPETPVSFASSYLKEADGILVMGVHPGRENQKFINNVYDKIRKIKKMTDKPIQIDGGVNDKTISNLKKAGVDIVNSGSFVSNAENPIDALRILKRA